MSISPSADWSDMLLKRMKQTKTDLWGDVLIIERENIKDTLTNQADVTR